MVAVAGNTMARGIAKLRILKMVLFGITVKKQGSAIGPMENLRMTLSPTSLLSLDIFARISHHLINKLWIRSGLTVGAETSTPY
jgi:hypothetical protein